MSLIGMALLLAGWSENLGLLNQHCVAVKPNGRG